MKEMTLFEIVSELENTKTAFRVKNMAGDVRLMVDGAVASFSNPVNYFGKLATISF